MSTETYTTRSSVVPYLAMIMLTFGIVLLIFGGMIDGAARKPIGPILSTVTIPTGIGLIIFGGMISKRAKRMELERRQETHPFFTTTMPTDLRCGRCKMITRSGGAFCPNCGQRL